MPHPIDRVVRGAEIVISPGAMVRNRPQLALMLIETLTRWAFVEAAVGDALAAILQEDATPVIQEFIQHPTTVGQRRILLEHAQQRLNEQDWETLQVLLDLFAKDFIQRNKLAHWLSGYSPQIADGILLVNPSERWKHAAEFWAWADIALGKTALEPVGPSPAPRRGKVYVYKEADFRNISQSISDLARAFDAFNEMHSCVVGHEAARARGYALLQTLPRFLQGLEKLRADRKAPPTESQSQSDAGLLRRLLPQRLARLLERFFGEAD